jgi:hypothetical protein
MTPYHVLVPAILTLLGSEAAFAGPCTAEIGKTQAQADAKLHRKALAGPTAKESSIATLHHQPSSETVAEAEKALGEGASLRAALAALKLARAADDKGDAAGCRAALGNAQNALKPRP